VVDGAAASLLYEQYDALAAGLAGGAAVRRAPRHRQMLRHGPERLTGP